MGRATGAFEATVSDDPAMFEPERLKAFDAVFFNNTNRDAFRPANFAKLPAEEKKKAEARDAHLKASFQKWLAEGHGLAAIHAACNMFREWPEFGNILGSRFWNHPWGAGSLVALKVEEPRHPLCAAFDAKGFTIRDEIYQLNDPYSRRRCRVLVSIDTERTDVEKVRKQIRRTDGDFAMTYIKTPTAKAASSTTLSDTCTNSSGTRWSSSTGSTASSTSWATWTPTPHPARRQASGRTPGFWLAASASERSNAALLASRERKRAVERRAFD